MIGTFINTTPVNGENFTEGEAYLIKLRDITETDDADTFYDICFEGPIQNTDVELAAIKQYYRT